MPGLLGFLMFRHPAEYSMLRYWCKILENGYIIQDSSWQNGEFWSQALTGSNIWYFYSNNCRLFVNKLVFSNKKVNY